MAQPGYIFGGNTGETPQSLATKRRLAEQIMGFPAPKNVGEGFMALANGFVAGNMRRQADEAEKAGMASADPIRQKLIAAITGQTDALAPTMGTATDANDGTDGDFMSALINSESGGNWQALNSEGYGGRLQFGDARLAEAAAAGIVPAGVTGADFSMMPPEVQQAVEQWHFNDIDRQAANMGLNQYFGQTVGGVPINADSIRAMAHLGGIGGAQKFITSGGQYNPADSNGTHLSDYGTRFGGTGAGLTPPAAAGGLDQIPMDVLISAISQPFLDPDLKSLAGDLLQQRTQQLSPRYQQQVRQADLDYRTGEARLAEINRPDWQTIKDGNGDYYRYDARDPNSAPQLWFDAPEVTGPAANGQLGTTIYTGRDEKGNLVPMQVGQNGFVPAALPPNVTFDPGAMNAEKAAGNVMGKGAGQAAIDLPAAANEVQRITTQIADLKASPGLDEVFGNLWGWTPIPNQWAPTLPNTEKANTVARIDQMSGNAFLSGRALLKGQGPITDFESKKAEAAFARLSTAQTKEEFLKAVDDFQEALEAGYAKIQANAQGTQFSVGGSPGGVSPTGNDPLGLF